MISTNYSPHNQITKNDIKSKDASQNTLKAESKNSQQNLSKISTTNSRPQIPNTGSVVKKGL